MRNIAFFTRLGARLSLAALLFSLAQAIAPVGAQAAGPSLVINEINWAGSRIGAAVTSNDDWIELFNASAADISLTAHTYAVMMRTTSPATSQEVVKIGAGTVHTGTIRSGHYYLISKLAESPSLGILPDATFEVPNPETPGIGVADLPATDVRYDLVLLNGEEEQVVDSAGTGSAGQPFGGSSCVQAGPDGTDCVTASMYRISPYKSGADASSWRTAMTRGVNFAANVEEYGTPANRNTVPLPEYGNGDLPQPTGLAVSPVSPTYIDTPVVTGTAGLPATDGVVVYRNALTKSDRVVSGPVSATGTFTASVETANPLPMGTYRIGAATSDGVGNRSAYVWNTVTGIDSSRNYVITRPTITLGEYPAATNKDTVTLTGTAPAQSLVTMSLNGVFYGSQVAAANGAFGFANVPLVANSSNVVVFQAQIGANNKSDALTITIVQDNIAPAALDASKLVLTSNYVGTPDTVSGLAGAAEAGTTAIIFADKDLTRVIVQGTVRADGSFGPLSIGDNQYAKVYVVSRDAAGNQTQPVALENIISFGTGNQKVISTVSSVGTDRITLTWEPVAGAVSYRMKYKVAGGTYSNPMSLCAVGGQACAYTTTVINLTPDTEYTFAMAAVDRFGNETAYSAITARTVALPAAAPVVNEPVAQAPVAMPAPPAVVSTPVPTPSPTPSISPSPSPTESGEVKSTTEEGKTNWTPWVVLGILIALAVLATAGYFYWFGGEAGEEAVTSVERERERTAAKPAPSEKAVPAKPVKTEKPAPKKGGDTEKPTKRW